MSEFSTSFTLNDAQNNRFLKLLEYYGIGIDSFEVLSLPNQHYYRTNQQGSMEEIDIILVSLLGPILVEGNDHNGKIESSINRFPEQEDGDFDLS